ncbi:zinc-dependent metalloprotease [Agrococcus sp. BE272]|uniref:zinc-dependent metalloprotease n=1 Tax=Agrococcus sp. BE272 TaxID=2817727 RepID=UPI002858A677|nr:zinc-dependent metalloprotease [Agrococcus sp. BE272]MDR7234259.1 putative hydrolase [Agrococcus sp. BE272]
MPEDSDDRRPEDELREMLQRFLSGEGPIDPARLAGAAGMPADPAQLQALMAQLQAALSRTEDGIDWSAATRQASAAVQRDPGSVTSAERDAVRQAADLAALWLGETTDIGVAATELQLLSRQQWVDATMPVWQEMSEPVANSIASALTRAMQEHAPEEAQEMLAGAERILRNVGGTMFAMQLGTVVGQLARETVAGGDFGFPLLEGHGALLPVNLRTAAEGLEIPEDQVRIWMAVRELAHARLFHHARWLRLHVLSSVREYAEGIRIDVDRLEELAETFDPTNPEELRQALQSGALIPPKTDEQVETLARLETTIALIEGWVDAVTESATQRLPRRDAIAETVRRRRASGGPAEKAFGTLVGLEIRPRRLREAAAFWRAVTDAVGPQVRDSLWDQPDLMPGSADIDDPSRVIARLQGAGELDEMDLALQELLDDAERDAAEPAAGSEPADGGEPAAEEASADEAGAEEPGADEPEPDGDADGGPTRA